MTDVDPGQYSVRELEEELQTITSVDTLESLLAAEKEGRDRTTARDAIEDRIADVAGDGVSTGDGESTLESVRSTADSTATGLVARSATLDRLFGDDLAEPVAETPGFTATFGLLVAAALWTVVAVTGGSLLWTVLATVGVLGGAVVVAFVATAVAGVDAEWLPATVVAATYLFVGVGLFLVTAVLRGLLGPGPVLSFGGRVGPAVAVLATQAVAFALAFETYSRPVLPAAELDGAVPRVASLHVANWWRVAGAAVAVAVVLVLGPLGWLALGGTGGGTARLAWLFLPPAGAVTLVLLYALRKAAVVETAVAEG